MAITNNETSRELRKGKRMKNIKILISECKCNQAFAESVERIVKEMGIEAKVTRIDNVLQMLPYNVMSLPALVINEKVVAKGKISDDEIRRLLSK